MKSEINIKYRTWYKGQPPRLIKLEIPGWAGEDNWKFGQPWHCKPFADGATYGLELIYPYDTEVRVTTNNEGEVFFETDSKSEWNNSGIEFPFKSFAPHHFGFTSSLDIQTEPGMGVMILPHPSFFTDRNNTVPIPSIGLIESDWWPKIFFIAFKTPSLGQTHIFKKGKGVAQVLIVPKDVRYNIKKMSREEELMRVDQEKALQKYGAKISNKSWQDGSGNSFDNKYKVLSLMESRENKSVVKYLNGLTTHMKTASDKTITTNRNKLSRIYIKPERKKC